MWTDIVTSIRILQIVFNTISMLEERELLFSVRSIYVLQTFRKIKYLPYTTFSTLNALTLVMLDEDLATTKTFEVLKP